MLENILIVVFVLMVLCALFMIGYFIGLSDALNMVEDREEESQIYCFECENETPEKEKNGDFYCSNCGLYHFSKV
jgi:ribosomal protein L37AE/L43A